MRPSQIIVPVAIVIATMIAMAALVASAHAQMACGQRAAILKVLDNKYQEVPTAFGITGRAMAELFISKTGSWTFLVTQPDGSGMTCILATGQSWEELPVAVYGNAT